MIRSEKLKTLSIRQEQPNGSLKNGKVNISQQTLPEKVLRVRDSYLTVSEESGHMQPSIHILWVILSLYGAHNIFTEIHTKGRISLGWYTYKVGFTGIQYAFCCWCLIHGLALIIFYMFKLWAMIISSMRSTALRSLVNYAFLICYIGSQLLAVYMSTICCLHYDLPFASAFALLTDLPRLLMKMHAFVRTNCAKVLQGKLKTDMAEKQQQPMQAITVSHYVYFFFAPTLLYRDNYPRSLTGVRWRFVLARFMEILGMCYIFSCVYEDHMLVHFHDFGSTKPTPRILVQKTFSMLVPSIVSLLCIFYMLLHSVQNLFAELLRFGDRMFYTNWWAAGNYNDFYRKWNCLVQDWLFEYIYKDIYCHVLKGSRIGASLAVFTISAIVHEYVVGFSLQVFLPVCYFSFGIVGVICVYVTKWFPKRWGNIFLWVSLLLGIDVIVSSYCMEYFAKRNCPKLNATSAIDNLLPHLLYC